MLLNKTDCKLSSLKIKELESKSNWQTIDLSHNTIDKIDSPELLQQQVNLSTLNLSYNPSFGAVGSEPILAHKAVKEFVCRACGFTEIQSQHFAGLVSLEKLLLSDNKIHRISESSFNGLAHFKLLDLENNQLKTLFDSTFVGLRRFEELRLTGNDLELPTDQPFLKSESMKRLFVNECKIIKIYPQTFAEVRQLEVLNLNRNEIELLPVNSFNSNLKLKSLFVESNRLKFFPGEILEILPQISELCIDNNTFTATSKFHTFVSEYVERDLRSENCNNDLKSFYIEELFPADVPSDIANTTEKSPKFVEKFINNKDEISKFFIGSYISLILIVQAVAFVLLTIYLIKITRYEKLEGEVNYANTILNDDEIYRVYNSHE